MTKLTFPFLPKPPIIRDAPLSNYLSANQTAVRTSLTEIVRELNSLDEFISTLSLDFLALTDTPNSYVGAAAKVVTVNAGETGLEFVAATAVYSDEQSQDAVGTILTDSSTIDFTYNDAGPTITAIVKGNSIGAAEIDETAAYTWSGNNTHSGNPIFSGNGTVTGSLTFDSDGLHIFDTNASHDLIITPGSDLTADRVLTLTTGDAARTITLSGNPTLADWFDQSVKAAATPQFVAIEFGSLGDATLARFGPSVLTIEGDFIVMADGSLGVGSTDNAIIRADGTGGVTVQGSGVTITDEGGLNLVGTDPRLAFIDSDTGADYSINPNNATGTLNFYTDFNNEVASSTFVWYIDGIVTPNMVLTPTALTPGADGNSSLGTTALGWQNLFANTGFVLNFENGDVTLTHSSNTLTLAGGDLIVPDEAYDDTGWNGDLSVPTKNAIRDGLVANYQPLDADLTSWAGVTRASGFDTFVATPTLANLGSLLTNEAAGVITFLTTPSSANFASMVTDDAFSLADAELSAIAGLVSAADRLPYFTGSGTASLATFTAYGRTLVALADEDALEALLDTLPNLVSIQGQTITLSDNNLDQLHMWDDSAGAILNATLARLTTEAAPAAGDYILVQRAEDDIVKVNWSSLPSASTISGSTGSVDNALLRADGTGGSTLQAGAAATLSDTADLTLTSTDAGATVAPLLILDRNSASPAADDKIGEIIFRGRDSGANATDYATVYGICSDPANGNEDGSLVIDLLTSGSSSFPFYFNSIFGSFYCDSSLGVLGRDTKPWASLFTTNIQLGHASDTTLTRSSAGVLAVEGNIVPSPADPNEDRVLFWDDSAGAYKLAALADVATEGSPATGDFVLMINSDDVLTKVDWASLPGGGGAVSASGTPANNQLAIWTSSSQIEGDAELTYDGSTLAVTGAISSTGNIASTVAALAVNLHLQSTDAGAVGPVMELFHNSASPAVGDNIGVINLYGKDSGGNTTQYIQMYGRIDDATNGSEDATLVISTLVGGTAVVYDEIGGNKTVTLESGSLSGATTDLVEDSTGLWARYRQLVLTITGGSTNNASSAITVVHSIDSGGSFISSGYNGIRINQAGSPAQLSATIMTSGAMAAANTCNSQFTFWNHNGVGNMAFTGWTVQGALALAGLTVGSYTGGTSPMNAIRIACSAGTMDAGTYTLIGIK